MEDKILLIASDTIIRCLTASATGVALDEIYRLVREKWMDAKLDVVRSERQIQRYIHDAAYLYSIKIKIKDKNVAFTEDEEYFNALPSTWAKQLKAYKVIMKYLLNEDHPDNVILEKVVRYATNVTLSNSTLYRYKQKVLRMIAEMGEERKILSSPQTESYMAEMAESIPRFLSSNCHTFIEYHRTISIPKPVDTYERAMINYFKSDLSILYPVRSEFGRRFKKVSEIYTDRFDADLSGIRMSVKPQNDKKYNRDTYLFHWEENRMSCGMADVSYGNDEKTLFISYLAMARKLRKADTQEHIACNYSSLGLGVKLMSYFNDPECVMFEVNEEVNPGLLRVFSKTMRALDYTAFIPLIDYRQPGVGSLPEVPMSLVICTREPLEGDRIRKSRLMAYLRFIYLKIYQDMGEESGERMEALLQGYENSLPEWVPIAVAWFYRYA